MAFLHPGIAGNASAIGPGLAVAAVSRNCALLQRMPWNRSDAGRCYSAA